MAEYISRDKVLSYVYATHSTGGFKTEEDYLWLQEAVVDTATSDVQPVKRGEWICNEELYYNGMAKCSCCNAEFYVEDLQTLQGDAECVKFCPNCGADMIEPETTKG